MGLRLRDENLTPPQLKHLPLQIGCHASNRIIGSYLGPRIRVCMVVCMYGGGYQAKLHRPSKVACEQLSIKKVKMGNVCKASPKFQSQSLSVQRESRTQTMCWLLHWKVGVAQKGRELQEVRTGNGLRFGGDAGARLGAISFPAQALTRSHPKL
jgi:hypothetical protein